MFVPKGYISVPDLIDRLWDEARQELGDKEFSRESVLSATKEKFSMFLHFCPEARLVGADDAAVFVGPHFLTDFHGDAFQHYLFDYRTGCVNKARHKPQGGKPLLLSLKTLRAALPIAFSIAALVIVAWVSAYRLPELMEQVLQPDNLTRQLLAMLVTVLLLFISLTPPVALLILARLSKEQSSSDPLRVFSGRSVAFSNSVVEETFQRIEAAKNEFHYLFQDTDRVERTWNEDSTPQAEKGGRPAVLREKMAFAYLELFPEGHGQLSVLEVLRKVNDFAGTDGSPDTLKRAIREAKRRQNPGKP